MPELVQTFKSLTGYTAQTVMGASGKLYMQIKNGAPYDVFLSADTDYPARLWQEDHLTAGPPIIYAYNALVLWVHDNPKQKDIPGILSSSAIKKIAIATPSLHLMVKQPLTILRKQGFCQSLTIKLFMPIALRKQPCIYSKVSPKPVLSPNLCCVHLTSSSRDGGKYWMPLCSRRPWCA